MDGFNLLPVLQGKEAQRAAEVCTVAAHNMDDEDKVVEDKGEQEEEKVADSRHRVAMIATGSDTKQVTRDVRIVTPATAEKTGREKHLGKAVVARGIVPSENVWQPCL